YDTGAPAGPGLPVAQVTKQGATSILTPIIPRRGRLSLHRRHVHETAVVPLEGDSDCRSRAVAVLGHDEVRLPRTGRLPLVGILAVQQDHYVRVLFNRTCFA